MFLDIYRFHFLIHQDTDQNLCVTVSPTNTRINWKLKFIPNKHKQKIIRKFYYSTMIIVLCRLARLCGLPSSIEQTFDTILSVIIVLL